MVILRSSFLARGLPARSYRFLSSSTKIGLVTAPELAKLLKSEDKAPIVLDASWHMPNLKPPRHGFSEFKERRIPGSGFFDLDIIASKDERGLAHMLPTVERFEDACSRLGIARDDHVVLLDSVGVFSSPRAAWTFKVFGHPRVSILNGGLPAWSSASLPLDLTPPLPPNPHSLEPDTETKFHPIQSVLLYDKRPRIESYFIADIEENFTDYKVDGGVREELVRSYEQVVENSKKEEGEVVLDARPAGRFHGTDPEPRPGLPSGHIPHSLSLPFTSLLSPEKTLLPPEALSEVFSKALGAELWTKVKSGEKGVAVTCGSGMTAAVVSLGLELAGREDGVGLYDESWTGYASRPESTIVKTEEE